MNIDEALIERIIREVVSQVVDEKADGGGQNRSASGNNQNSMQSVNLGQIEQLGKMLLPVIDKHHLVDKHRMPVDIIQKSQFMMWISRKILLPVK